MKHPHISDDDLRIARDALYPVTTQETKQSDKAWENCKKYWREDAVWLMEHYSNRQKFPDLLA